MLDGNKDGKSKQKVAEIMKKYDLDHSKALNKAGLYFKLNLIYH